MMDYSACLKNGRIRAFIGSHAASFKWPLLSVDDDVSVSLSVCFDAKYLGN